MQIALPLVVSSLSITLMQFIDRMFLLWDSASSLAAAMPAAMMYWLVICLPLGVCMYANTFVSQYFGAERHARIGAAVWQGIWAALFCTPLVMLTIPLAPVVFDLAGHDLAIRQQEVIYYQIMICGAGGALSAAALSSFFTGRGMTWVVMASDGAAAVINIVLDYCWIFGHFGFPAWGIEGAGWATVVALWFKALLLMALFLRSSERARFGTWAGRGLDLQLLRRLLKFGMPSGLHMMLEVAGFSVFIFVVGRLGEVELAATNLTFSVSMVAFMPVWGLGTAVSVLVGQRLGEKRDDLAARATYTSLVLALGYIGLLSVLFIATPQLFLLGHDSTAGTVSAEVRALTMILLGFVAAYNLFDALNMIFVSVLKGAGDTAYVLWVGLVMAAALAIGSYAAVEIFHWGLYGVWTVATLWLCAMGGLMLWRFLHGAWRTRLVIEAAPDDLGETFAESLADATAA